MSKTILIVDDDPNVLSVLESSFQKANFNVQTANNGLEALKQARITQPDLILLDLVLPDMDGFTVCESLKHHPDTSSIPVLALTGLCGQLSHLTAIESGANGYFTKPCNLGAILAAANRLLQLSDPQQDSSKSDKVNHY